MAKNISEICRDYYGKHKHQNSILYTDRYGKTVIEETSFAIVVYNHHNDMTDIYCTKCGEWLSNANCTTNGFWNFIHDVVHTHKCSN